MSGEGKVVCVTGASGFIASWLVKLLLEHGYTVKATVRDPKRLHIFKANLMEEGSFDSAVDGCEGVFHTASPVFLSTNDPQAELIDPAVKGTLNVLRSCAKVQSVKRVVITSSTASVFFNERLLTPDVVADETLVFRSRFLQEIKRTGVDTFPRPYRFVDVRDVAYAHVQALEVPTASGRYLLVGKVTQRCEGSEDSTRTLSNFAPSQKNSKLQTVSQLTRFLRTGQRV
ncbi:hypothetical protein Pint_23933 [Pistacia integerrima]|uniref:Uncharacterized protein n=1 Tax=Pistacia integerrima TaxID=434235 RepID=A0ACC0YNB8_9ROSI|nr:hypothetical protein Pint_23933 [Pistacia integerrima]